MNRHKLFANLAWGSLIALIVLCIAWEAWLAPLRPGGSTLVLKAAPLLLTINGIVRLRRYTHQWTSMLSLLYLAEGIVRAYAEPPPVRLLALAEVILSIGLFVGCVGFSWLNAAKRSASH